MNFVFERVTLGMENTGRGLRKAGEDFVLPEKNQRKLLIYKNKIDQKPTTFLSSSQR